MQPEPLPSPRGLSLPQLSGPHPCLPHQPFRAPHEPSSFPPWDLLVCLFLLLELLCIFPCSPAFSPRGSPQESPKQVQVLSHLIAGTPCLPCPSPVLRSTPPPVHSDPFRGCPLDCSLTLPTAWDPKSRDVCPPSGAGIAPPPGPEPALCRCSISTC